MRSPQDFETFVSYSDRVNPVFAAESESYFEIGRQDALNGRTRKCPTRMPSWREQYYAGYATGSAVAMEAA